MSNNYKNNKIFAGLTGGIASGKSAVSKLFFDWGAEIIDADKISRIVVEKGHIGHEKLKEVFPHAFSDGFLDRSKLRNIVFDNNVERKKLDSIMHPLIKNEVLRLKEASLNNIIILDAPLLFEAGFGVITSPNITVSCSRKIRLKRLMERDSITNELAQKMIDSQWSDEMREKNADIILCNNGSMEELITQAKGVFDKLTK